MPAQSLTEGVIFGLIFIWAIARQILPRRVNRITFVLLPIIGIYESVHSLPHPTIPPSQVIECGIALVVSIVIGSLQAQVTKVYKSADNQVYMRGGWLYLALWIVLFASRFLIYWIFRQPGDSFPGASWIMWADMAFVWGTRSLVLYLKHPEIRTQLVQGRQRQRDWN